MQNNEISPTAISHKELNILLKKALKEESFIDSPNKFDATKYKEFNDLVSSWSEISQKILLLLNKKEDLVTKDRSAKSVMALGAMGAHINMAIQALKAAEHD